MGILIVTLMALTALGAWGLALTEFIEGLSRKGRGDVNRESDELHKPDVTYWLPGLAPAGDRGPDGGGIAGQRIRAG
jgi:hypothetical protein